MKFGIFDHIERRRDVPTDQQYRERLELIAQADQGGIYCYHLAEHHHSPLCIAPSQSTFLAAVAQRTERLLFGPLVYVLPLHHPIRLIEEICMLDNLSDGRLEIGVGRGGLLEAYFWGQEGDVEINQARYEETLEIIKEGLSHDELTYHGEFYTFDELPMRLGPKQKPYPPLWYMRNVETAAINGMNTIIVGSLDSFTANVERYHETWEEHQGLGALTAQGTEPKVALIAHMVVAETDQEAMEIAGPAWETYRWNLGTPRRLEAERRGLEQYLGPHGQAGARPKSAPPRELRRDIEASIETFDKTGKADPRRLGGVAMAGSPASVREYMDEYLATGANYFVCSFQWGNINHEHAMQSVELFATEVMPHYVTGLAPAGAG